MTTPILAQAASDTQAFDRWLSLGLKNQFCLADALPGELLSLLEQAPAEPACN